jgi:hypothetical protein
MTKPDKPGLTLGIALPTERLLKGLGITCVVLLLIHVALTICHYRWIELPWLLRQLFDVDEEESIPTWFSSAVLLLVAVVLFFIYSLKRRVRDSYANSWAGLGAGFTFMSIDEIAGFHETLNSMIEMSWAVPGLVVAMLVGLLYLKFLFSLPAAIAIHFIIAGAIFIGGAIGVELATEPFLYNDELDTLAYNLWTPVEEGMEMGGVIFFLAGLFDYLKSTFQMEFSATATGMK